MVSTVQYLSDHNNLNKCNLQKLNKSASQMYPRVRRGNMSDYF